MLASWNSDVVSALVGAEVEGESERGAMMVVTGASDENESSNRMSEGLKDVCEYID